VKDKVGEIAMGGTFEVILDSKNPQHTISQTMRNFILDDLDATVSTAFSSYLP
jgi:TusA-related sulfurtransferase